MENIENLEEKVLTKKMYAEDVMQRHIDAYKKKGLRLYHIENQKDMFDVIEFKFPFKRAPFSTERDIIVFALTEEEYEGLKKISENIKEMIVLTNKKIGLLKQMVFAVANEISKKP